MRWLACLLMAGAASTVSADTVRVCYNYGCLAEAEAHFEVVRMVQLAALLGAAQDAPDERERLSLAVGWMLGWAGEQTPIGADRGGNFADQAVFGRMDCIDHSTTTTRLLRLLEARGWLRFHRVAEPVQRVRYLVQVHFSAQIEEIPGASEVGAGPSEPARHVVDSWFRDNGQPAVVMRLEDWLAGDEDQLESVAIAGRLPE